MKNVNDIQNKLEIIIITYNRSAYLDSTLKCLLDNKSPVKNISITVLDNQSTDDTEKICSKYSSKHPNISHIKNKYNVGLSGNVVKAIEYASKDYFWILGDDDKFDWENWNEVEQAINSNQDLILIAQEFLCPTEVTRAKQCVFISGVIYKKSIVTNEVIKNIYDAIPTIIPHAPLFCSVLNDDTKSFYYLKGKPVAKYGYDGKTDVSYTRGYKKSDLYPRIANMSFYAGAAEAISLLKDNELRTKMLETWITLDEPDKNIKDMLLPEFKNAIKSGEGISLSNVFAYYINFDSKHRRQIIKCLVYAYFKWYLIRKLRKLFNKRKKVCFFKDN